MSNSHLDPLIRREFEALGVNIVANDALAEMVIEKVRKRRIRAAFFAASAAAAIVAIVGVGYFVGTSSIFGSKNIVQSNSYVQSSSIKGVLALPQFARMRVTQSTASHHAIFTFDLTMGEAVEIFTQPKGAQSGFVGNLSVYSLDKSGNPTFIQKFPIGLGTGLNEFGDINRNGLYQFRYDITDMSYQGEVEIGFLLGHQ